MEIQLSSSAALGASALIFNPTPPPSGTESEGRGAFRDWFTRNYADTDKPTHSDLRPVALPLAPTAALDRIQHLLQGRPRWSVVLVDGKPVTAAGRSPWPWVRGKEAVWSVVTTAPAEVVFRIGPTWPNAGWLTATRRTWMMRFIDGWYGHGAPGGCEVHAESQPDGQGRPRAESA